MLFLRKKIYIFACLFLFSQDVYSLSLGVLENINPFVKHEVKKKELELYYFWATWCQSCERKLRYDLPQLESDKLAVYSINIDKNPKRALFYIKKKKIKLPVLRDPKKKWQKHFDVQAVPYWILFRLTKSGKRVVVAKEVSFDMEKIKKLSFQ